MENKLQLRLLDRVELHGQIVATFNDGTVNVQVDESVSSLIMVRPSAIKSIISRAETDAEKIARLEAELAKAPRRIVWHGSECPLPLHTRVVVWSKSGLPQIGVASDFWWHGPQSVKAYMVLPS